jgi:succinoglycan biosynthesis transport protein ExoP
MDAKNLTAALRRHWILVACAVALGLGGATAGLSATTPQYESEVQLFVSAPGSASDSSAAYQGGLFSQQRVLSYADIIASPQVLRPVIERLGLRTDAAELERRITARVPADTVLVNVHVRDPSPDQARRIAGAVAEEFIDFAERLERPDARGRSPVLLSLSKDASLPSTPVSPRTKIVLALGLLGGLLLGAAAAFVLERLDKSVKRFEDLEAEGSAAPLGAVPFDPALGEDPVVGLEGVGSMRAEALRHIRTSLRFLDVDAPPQKLLFTSAVEGEGKSTTAAGIAAVFALAGVKTVLVEADLRRPSLARYLGLAAVPGISDVLVGSDELDDALQERSMGDAVLTVLCSGRVPPMPSEMLESSRMQALMARLAEQFDCVVLDGPPLLPVADSVVLAGMVDAVVMVLREGRTEKSSAQRALTMVRAANVRHVGVVMSMVRPDGADAYRFTYYAEPAIAKR